MWESFKTGMKKILEWGLYPILVLAFLVYYLFNKVNRLESDKRIKESSEELNNILKEKEDAKQTADSAYDTYKRALDEYNKGRN